MKRENEKEIIVVNEDRRDEKEKEDMVKVIE